jgi:hypothetical protein
MNVFSVLGFGFFGFPMPLPFASTLVLLLLSCCCRCCQMFPLLLLMLCTGVPGVADVIIATGVLSLPVCHPVPVQPLPLPVCHSVPVPPLPLPVCHSVPLPLSATLSLCHPCPCLFCLPPCPFATVCHPGDRAAEPGGHRAGRRAAAAAAARCAAAGAARAARAARRAGREPRAPGGRAAQVDRQAVDAGVVRARRGARARLWPVLGWPWVPGA